MQGALQVLTDCGILPKIKQVAGTSAGAITAALVALGYTAPEIKSIIMSMDFKQLEDGWDPLRLPTDYGFHIEEQYLFGLIQKMIAAKSDQRRQCYVCRPVQSKWYWSVCICHRSEHL